jgi:lipopolysaccharide/colanic/teichoic acid biosynthesis glycosyltransferase
MKNSIIPNLHNYYTMPQEHLDKQSYCTLQWRRGQLLVKLPCEQKQQYLPSLDKQESLVECLQHSSVSLVRIDPKLGEAKLTFWANACEEAGKPMFLSIPRERKLSNVTPSRKWLKFFIEWLAALMFLVAASPIMLGLLVLMRVYSPGAIFKREWHVGERGKLFRIVKFRTIQTNTYGGEGEQNMTSLGSWMHKYSLDNLPQLLNVLRGDMHLTGRRSWKLEDAIALNPEGQRRLNKAPGLTSSWEVETESSLLHLDSQVF